MRRIPGYEAWAFFEKAEGEALKELETMSDRAAGIVAATMLERRLETLVKRKLICDDEALIRDLFRESAPLGTFSTKIKMAYVLGVVTKDGRKDLESIKNIRNDFAHKLEATSFDVDFIKARCLNLRLVDKLVGELDSTLTMEDLLNGIKVFDKEWQHGKLYFAGANEALKDARSRFFLTINCLIYATLKQTRAGDPQPPYF